MKYVDRILSAVLSVLLLCTYHQLTLAQVSSTTSGSWNNGSTWNSSMTPQVGDDVIISSGTTVTVDLSNTSVLKSVVVESNAELVITTNGYIVIGVAGWGRSLTVHGVLTLQNGGAITVNGAWMHFYGTVNMN
ncbi:MAG: hypothetical protein KFH87_08495, partial [Bacteroidetes bacterium]|nr:hypothetical protein [Bacteroidota bacterium]